MRFRLKSSTLKEASTLPWMTARRRLGSEMSSVEAT
jgi:hypothetical protein